MPTSTSSTPTRLDFERVCKDAANLAADNQRLREALTAIYTMDQGASELMFIAKVQQIAADALTGR
jgi:hypothetical protein